MGLRLRKIIPFNRKARLNISKSGVSVSLGSGKGLTANVSGRGIRTTFGLPGSGISYGTKRYGFTSANIMVAVFIIALIYFFA